jgi:hypothetical protein
MRQEGVQLPTSSKARNPAKEVSSKTHPEQEPTSPADTHLTSPGAIQRKRRCIDSMPIEVHYPARIPRVLKVNRSGETAFVTTSWVEGREGIEERVGQEWLDAFEILDEFFNVKTERQALDFLRANGDFLPFGGEISWSAFQLWQRLAQLVRERNTLSAAHRDTMLACHPHPSKEFDEILRLLTGIYPHEYFGPQQVIPESDLENVRRAAEIFGQRPDVAIRELREGEESIRRRQRNLETWFSGPPPDAYSIQFALRVYDPERMRDLERGGAMIGLLFFPEELKPILVIHARCAIHAIAGAIYAERIAGVHAGKCKGCGEWFEIGSHKSKLYCENRRCRQRVKKQNQRNNTRKRNGASQVPGLPSAFQDNRDPQRGKSRSDGRGKRT